MIKADNYISIQGWMVTDLNLYGNDLIVYAIIYGFTQDMEHWFEGTIQYMADWCNCTKRGIYKNIDNLIDAGLIEKSVETVKGVKHCKYRVTDIWSSEQSSLGDEQSSLGVVNKVHEGSEQSSLNNIDNNINKKYIDKCVGTHSQKLVKDSKDCVDIFKELYDKHCPSGAKPRQMKTANRKRIIQKLFKEYSRNEREDVLIKAEKSSWLKEKKLVSVAFILNLEHFNQILEGYYDDRKVSVKPKSVESRYNPKMSAKGTYRTNSIV